MIPSEVLEHPVFPLSDARHLSPVGLGVVVEVPGVALVAHLRDYRGLQLLVVNLLPVNILEPPWEERYQKLELANWILLK